MTIIKDSIQDVADLLEEQENWCQGSFAMTEARDKIASPGSPAASCWCILGAVIRTVEKRKLNRDQANAVKLQLDAGIHAYLGTGQMSITKFNDTHTHEQVVEMLQQTAERVK